MNIPKLRFKEFSDSWEEKSFKNIFKINQGLQIAISERFLEPSTNRMFYITNEFLRKDSKIKYYIENPPKNVICNKEDILMTRTGNTGEVVTDIDGAFHNNFFKINYDKNNFNKKFICYVLKSSKIQNIILKFAGASTIPDLNHSDFYKIKSFFPCFEEQEKIGNFLSSVDKKISITEEKLNLFKDYKKGMMQKIFTQKLRFKDKNGNEFPDWVEKRLGDIGETYNGLSGKTADDFGNGKKYITYKNIYDNTKINMKILEFVEIKDNEKQNKVEYGDIFFTTSSETPEEVGYTSILLDKIKEDIYLNSFCFGYRLKNKENFYLEFFRYVLKSKKFRNSIYLLAQGSTRFNLSKIEVLKLKISLPCLEEQEKIANFLSSIDNKIENLSKTLENLKEFKKGLLQKMFI